MHSYIAYYSYSYIILYSFFSHAQNCCKQCRLLRKTVVRAFSSDWVGLGWFLLLLIAEPSHHIMFHLLTHSTVHWFGSLDIVCSTETFSLHSPLKVKSSSLFSMRGHVKILIFVCLSEEQTGVKVFLL